MEEEKENNSFDDSEPFSAEEHKSQEVEDNFEQSFEEFFRTSAEQKKRKERREKKNIEILRASLDWRIDDFEGVTESVYEAVMVAARRARQVGRRQKQEIDAWNTTLEATEMINPESEENDEPGIDHFHHVKPTVRALNELKDQKIKYYYEQKEKDKLLSEEQV